MILATETQAPMPMTIFCAKTINCFSELVLKSQVESICNQGKLNSALKLIFSAPKAPLSPSLYLNILQLCINENAERPARLIHSHIITNGFDSNVHLNTKLIILYGKIGDLVWARRVFDKMPDRSVVSWTAMISGYSQKEFYENALLVFAEMRRAGVNANQFTYGSALRACTGLRCLEGGMQIQGCVQKGRFVRNLIVQSALLDLHAKCGKMEHARLLFDTMAERDVVSWNAMVGGYAFQGFADDSFQMFKSMMMEGKTPDCFTFGSILRASIGGCDLLKVSQVHALIIQLGFGAYKALTGSLVDTYSKCGSIRSACQLYKSMIEKDIITCTALIAGFAREHNYTGDAFDLFKEAILLKIGVDEVILCSILNICATTASISVGRQIHAFALKYQPSYDVAMGNALIDMYAKSGEIEDANHAFDEMKEKNVISWTSLISGYGKHGYGDQAIALYKKMECQGLKPNDVTFLSLFFACSHTGLISEGWKLFNTMVSKYNISPRAEHVSCIVDLFARGGQLEVAYTLICEMNINPSPSLWSSLLGACRIYGNISLGEAAARHLLNIEPAKSANYVVLASMYAAAGAWDNAWKTCKLMEERGSLKDPAYSLLSCTGKKMVLLQP